MLTRNINRFSESEKNHRIKPIEIVGMMIHQTNYAHHLIVCYLIVFIILSIFH